MAKRNKTQRIKMDKFETEEQLEVKQFIKILIILVILVVGVYLFTKFVVAKDTETSNETRATEGKIDYNKTLIGAMLTRPEDEYYVIIYDMEDELTSAIYGSIVSKYNNNKTKLKVYTADLSNELNKKYVASSESETNLTSLDNLKIYKFGLVKVSKGAIVKSFTTASSIEEELKYVKSTSN